MEDNAQQTQAQGVPQADPADAEKNKGLAIVGYLIPILFFVPLVTDAKNSPFAKFHANQQLLLLLACMIIQTVGAVVPVVGWFVIWPVGWVAIAVFAIMGLIGAAQGKMKPLPLIGTISLIK